MAEFPYLEWLGRRYKQKGEETGDWVDYLKAHGLANSCLVRDSTEERRRLVYVIEESWYEGRHPLTYYKHKQLTKNHKQLLKTYRDETRNEFAKLGKRGKCLDAKNIFTDNNISCALEFSNEIFQVNKKCSEGLAKISSHLIESSVDTLKRLSMSARCDFAVIGLGSLAKGEATPYSDLEYAFIVEEHSDYFAMLAVESYFRIGNLGETPLKCFDISELNAKGDFQTDFDADMRVGYRIDGISPKAGNVPTGNGSGGQTLTLTVEEFMELYKASAEAPFDGMAGDKSDMLSSSVLVYSSQGERSTLHERFLEIRKIYEHTEGTQQRAIVSKRIESFKHDLNEYVFIPEFIGYQPPNNLNVRVKTDIFRYPTLLFNNMKMILKLEENYPWDVCSELLSSGKLSLLNYRYLTIVLALSIYMRTSACIDLEMMTESVLLGSHSIGISKAKHHLPFNLFVTLGCLLVPIKESIRSTILMLPISTKVIKKPANLISAMLANIAVDKNDFLLKVEVCYFFGDYDFARKELSKGIGTNIENIACVNALRKLQAKSQSLNTENICFPPVVCCISSVGNRRQNKTAVKWAQLCCYLLYYTHRYVAASDYFHWLIRNAEASTSLWKLLLAHCNEQMGDYINSRRLINQVKQRDPRLATSVRLFDSMNPSDGEEVNHRDAYIAHENIGSVYYILGEYECALKHYTKALDITKAVYGSGSDHCDIAKSYNNIGLANYHVARYEVALEFYVQSLEMYKAVLGSETPHFKIAEINNNIGGAHRSMDNYKLALEFYTQSLDMYKAVFGSETQHSCIANTYNNIGNAHYCMGGYKLALNFYTQALEMNKAAFGRETVNSSKTDTYINIGNAHLSLGSSKLALNFYTQSLKMRKAAFGSEAQHSSIADIYNNIGVAYSSMGDHKLALKFYTKSLEKKKAVFGSKSQHLTIADTYGDIGNVYYCMTNYKSALEFYTQSLEMKRAVFGSETQHPSIANTYNNIGNAHYYLGSCKQAWHFYTLSFDMFSAVSGSETAHPGVAMTHRNMAIAYFKLDEHVPANPHTHTHTESHTEAFEMMSIPSSQ